MGGKSSPPPPPDYTPIANASKEAAEISAGVARDQLAWAKDQYKSDKAITDRVVNKFLATQDVNAATAAADRARYERVYQPLEDRLAAEAIDYASPERQRIEEGRAQAAVAQHGVDLLGHFSKGPRGEPHCQLHPVTDPRNARPLTVFIELPTFNAFTYIYSSI